jgi:protein involved in temperature-dependent protein secretion
MLARQTDWEAIGDELFLGHGQKCLSTDVDMFGLLDLRELRVNV